MQTRISWNKYCNIMQKYVKIYVYKYFSLKADTSALVILFNVATIEKGMLCTGMKHLFLKE